MLPLKAGKALLYMEEKNKLVREAAEKKYEYGFTTDVQTEIIDKGLNEDVIRLISQKKG